MKKNCNSKISHTCGTKNYSTCIEYEGLLPEFSELIDCVNLEETTEELYNLASESQLSGLGESCLTYIETLEGKIIVKNVLLKFEEEICALKTKIEELETVTICNISIEGCDFSFGTLLDACGEQPTTLKGVLQLLLNQHNV